MSNPHTPLEWESIFRDSLVIYSRKRCTAYIRFESELLDRWVSTRSLNQYYQESITDKE